jgi:hypothetical protein
MRSSRPASIRTIGWSSLWGGRGVGTDGSWSFEAIGGRDAVLHLASVSIDIPLAELYAFTIPAQEPNEPADQAGEPLQN